MVHTEPHNLFHSQNLKLNITPCSTECGVQPRQYKPDNQNLTRSSANHHVQTIILKIKRETEYNMTIDNMAKSVVIMTENP